MFNHKHYVPILKGKMGEYSALHHLDQAIRGSLTPLIEVPPIEWDFDADQPSKSIDQQLDGIGPKLANAWPESRPLFLDLVSLADEGLLVDGTHPLTHTINAAREQGVLAIPVTGVRRDAPYQAAVRSAAEQDGNGICVRLQEPDFENPSGLAAQLTELFGSFGSPPAVDIVIDFGELPRDHTRPFTMAVRSVLSSLPLVQDWRTVTFAGSSFPQNLSDVQPGTSDLPRAEWRIWESLVTGGHPLPRIPTFGDYAIAHPIIGDVDFRFMRISAQIRYTTDNDWLIVKGRSVREYGHEQFYDLCRLLVARPEYRGPAFSWGDDYIDRAARTEVTPGNPMIWRRIGTSHHLTHVVDQISNLDVP